MKLQAKLNTSPKPKKDYRCKDCEYWKEYGWVCTLTFKHAGDLAKKCKKFKLKKPIERCQHSNDM